MYVCTILMNTTIHEGTIKEPGKSKARCSHMRCGGYARCAISWRNLRNLLRQDPKATVRPWRPQKLLEKRIPTICAAHLQLCFRIVCEPIRYVYCKYVCVEQSIISTSHCPLLCDPFRYLWILQSNMQAEARISLSILRHYASAVSRDEIHSGNA